MTFDPSDSAPRGGSLFDDDDATPLDVQAATPDPRLERLAGALPARLRMGTSSWHFPGWASLVWDRLYSEKLLSQEGLAAYAQHPLFGAVGLDRGFYRPLTAAQYAGNAAQVPDSFRFVVKAPALVSDALVRNSRGQGRTTNSSFLDSDCALREFVAPASAGLGDKLGALVFQISPLSARWLDALDRLIGRLHGMLRTAADSVDKSSNAVVAVEVRNPEWLTPRFVDVLKDTGATYCLGCIRRCHRSPNSCRSCGRCGRGRSCAAGT